MKRLKYFCMAILLLLTTFLTDARTVSAAEEEYTYTVRLYAGNLGKLTPSGVEVDSASANITSGKDYVAVTGLKYGDTVYINPQNTASVTDERYYVRGVRRSGRDNSEAEVPTFQVASDRDYVVAYGIKGDMAAYTVNYQDTAGNTLKASDTYYGNIGERQYVSARYIDGYRPQTLNMVKTLSSNETENVFTFLYQAVTANEAQTPNTTTTTTTTTTTNTTGGTNTGGTNTGNTTGTADAANGAADADNQEEVPDEDVPLGGDAAPVENVPDEDVPLNLQDLEEVEDGETPLAALKLEQAGLMGYFPIYLGIGMTAALMMLVAGIFLYKKHRSPKAVKAERIKIDRAGRPKR